MIEYRLAVVAETTSPAAWRRLPIWPDGGRYGRQIDQRGVVDAAQGREKGAPLYRHPASTVESGMKGRGCEYRIVSPAGVSVAVNPGTMAGAFDHQPEGLACTSSWSRWRASRHWLFPFHSAQVGSSLNRTT